MQGRVSPILVGCSRGAEVNTNSGVQSLSLINLQCERLHKPLMSHHVVAAPLVPPPPGHAKRRTGLLFCWLPCQLPAAGHVTTISETLSEVSEDKDLPNWHPNPTHLSSPELGTMRTTVAPF